jgi:glycosyltransferase involved in cell wall biosynthesis
MRRVEAELARRSECSFLTTGQELTLLRSVAPEAVGYAVENGVDFNYFDPAAWTKEADFDCDNLSIVFTGAMSYYPNAQAVLSFAKEVYPELRRSFPALRFLIVGRDPSASVRKLEEIPGIEVTGAVEDIRPYIASSTAVVAPLAIARGIQNKVLEALAMGKPAMCSPAVCSTFGQLLPQGVTLCRSADDYVAVFSRLRLNAHRVWPEIRQNARQRFSWENNLRPLRDAIDSAIHTHVRQAAVRSI